jgi:hypothetical protein
MVLCECTTVLNDCRWYELADTDAFYEGEIESKEKMNRIAGGAFWEKLAVDYYNRGITFAQRSSLILGNIYNLLHSSMKYYGICILCHNNVYALI